MTELEIITALKKMEADPKLITKTAFTANTAEWPTNRMPFVEFHVHYLRTHKLVRAEGYLSNLRLMLRAKVNS